MKQISRNIIIFILAAYLVNYIFLADNDTTQSVQLQTSNQKYDNISLLHKESAENINISDDDAVRGSIEATVLIVEFCDFQYPLCEKVNPEIKNVLEVYEGKVKFVYRDYPLDVFAFSQKAAEASECAKEQGKYWEYYDRLFESREWVEKGVPQLKKYAEELELNVERFDSCIENGSYNREVLNDFEDGKALGITMIPAFFVNDKILIGNQSFVDFHRLIEVELNRLGELQKYGEVEFYSFEKGIKEARKLNKTAFLYFKSEYCHWCKKFEEEVLANKSVADKIKRNFVPVVVDVDAEMELSSKFGVFGTPAMVFIYNEKELERLVGFRDAEAFLNELDEVI